MPLDLLDRVRSFPLFLSAPEEFLVAVGNHLKPQIHVANDQIITEGEEARAMYWLARGVVAVTSRDGEAVYAELKPGSFFGEIGILMKMPRTANIVARTKCMLLVLKKEDLQAIMPQFPEMEKAIREEAQERLNLLKKRRREDKIEDKSPSPELSARAATPGVVSQGESGKIKDGTVVNSKKRKSSSPCAATELATCSAIGSGLVNIRRTLKELPLFSTLPPEILHFLGLSAQPKTYPPFADIVRQGTPGNEIYFLVRGEAEVLHDQRGHHQPSQPTKSPMQERPRLRRGQYFGEVASLGLSRGRTATVRSITAVECLMIPGEAVDELWRRCPPEIKTQVEQTARTRLSSTLVEDDTMTDSHSSLELRQSQPPTRTSLPQVAFTSANPESPCQDDSEGIEPKDPDPFLSVDMENLRNRRRNSLAPPTPPPETPDPKTRYARISPAEYSPLTPLPSRTPPSSDVPAKRAKIFPQRSREVPKPAVSDVVLVRVFQRLDVGELCRLRIVSSHWKKLLTSAPQLCRHVDLVKYNRTVTDQIIIQVLAPFIGKRAETVDISNCFHITDDGFSALWRTCGRNIKRWRMRSVWDVSANQILEMTENAKQLVEVDWSNCRKVGDNLLCRVVGWVVPEPPSQNKAVMISNCAGNARDRTRQQQVHKENAQNIVQPGTVIGCPRLHTLNLSYCKHVTDRSMAHLAAHASSRLKSLSLTRCTSITDAGFQSWAQYKFEQLTQICLADCTYLSDNAIVALVNAAKNLTHLDLSFCCALSDTATEVVALGLPKLRELRLAFCGSAVSDGSLESVAFHLSELDGLSVRGCVRVTGRGAESILRHCGRLAWLDVSQCRNLEAWFQAGGVSRWGFDENDPRARAWQKPALDLAARPTGKSGLSQPSAPICVMLSSPNFVGGIGRDLVGRASKPPVRFVVQKGVEGLR